MSWIDDFKQEQIFINREEKHSKYWSAVIDDKTHKTTIKWGRLGTKGQSQTKTFASNYAASIFVHDKIREKRRKGYDPVDKATFEKASIEAAIVGTQNKCGQLEWVEITDPTHLEYKPCSEARLQDPSCNPGIIVNVETRKKYDGRTSFNLLFTFNQSFNLNTKQIITRTSPIYELTSKVEEAIGRSLTETA